MKKTFLTTIFALLITACAIAQVGTQFSATSGEKSIKYEVTVYDADDKQVKVISGGDYTGIVTIPTTATDQNGFTYNVTTIGKKAFYGISDLTEIIISEGITTIEDYAFGYCYDLTTAALPNSATNIGTNTFQGCGSLNTVTLPNNITTITFSMFSSAGLTSFTMPESVTTIEDYAFSDNNFTTINIPAAVTTIGDNVFSRCSNLTEITVAEGNQHYTAENGVLFNKDKSVLMQYPNGKTGESYTMPSAVKSIAGSAFTVNQKLKTVVCSSEATNIGSFAFAYTSITSITLPSELLTIDRYAFHNCKSLTAITIPSKVTSIEQDAFSECSKLATIKVEVQAPPSLAYGAFQWIDDAYTITVPSGKEADYMADDKWSAYNIVVPEGQVGHRFKFGDFYYMITDAENDYAALVAPSGEKYEIANVSPPQTVKTADLTVYTLTAIEDEAFSSNTAIETLVVPEGVTHIKNSAFYYSNVQSISLPSTLVEMENSAFYGCSSLTSIAIAATVPPTLVNASIAEIATNHIVSVPAGSESAYVTHEYWGVLNIIVPQGAVGYKFKANDIMYRVIDAENKKVEVAKSDSEGGYTMATINILATVTDPAEGGETYNVTAIGEDAFYYANATSIAIPEGITVIGGSAFCGTKITSITLPSTIDSIASFAFRYSKLTSITIPEGVTYLGSSAFAESKKLTTVKLPSTLQTILYETFVDCELLSSVTFAEGLKYINNYAFNRCNAIATITLPSTLLEIASRSFTSNVLSTIYVNALNPPIMRTAAFSNLPSDHKIFVPADSVDTYKNTPYCWKDYNIYSNATHTITMQNGTASVTIALESEEVTVSTSVNENQEFTGWTASPEVTFADANSLTTTFTMPAQDVTITANFKGAAYTLTFNANEGECGTASKEVNYGAYIGELPTATRSGYALKEWTIEGTTISEITQWLYSESKTAEAQWIEAFIITFDSKGGEGSMTSQIINYKQTVALTENAFTREGYTFEGWDTDESADEVIYNDLADYTATATATLYAVWSANNYYITKDSDLINGSLSVSYSADFGETVTVTANPDYGYQVNTITTNIYGLEVTHTEHATTATFIMPAQDVEITATFEKTEETLIADAKAEKKAAIDALNTYAEGNYSAENWVLLAKIFTDAKAEVEALGTVADIESYDISGLTTTADAIETNESLVTALANAKTAKKAAIDALNVYTESEYRATDWTTLLKIFTDAKAEVDALGTVAEVEGYDISGLTTAANAIKTDTELTAEELATAKADKKAAIDALNVYTESEYRAADWTALLAIFTDAKAEVEAFDAVADVESYDINALTTAANAIKTDTELILEELANAKTAKKAAIDALNVYTESEYRATDWTTLLKIFTDAKAVVDILATKELVEGYDISGLTDLAEAIKTDAELIVEEEEALIAAELAQAKADKKADIDALNTYSESDYRTAEWAELEAIFTEAKEDVDAFTTKTEVENFDISDLTDLAEAIKTDAELTAEEESTSAEELATAKTAKKDAIDLLNTYSESDYRTAEWTDLQAIFTEAKDAVEAFTTISQVEGYDISGLTTLAEAIKTDAELTAEEESTSAEELATAKTTKKDAIDLLNTYSESDYRTAEWTELEAIFTEAKEDVDAFTTKTEVENFDISDLTDLAEAIKTDAELTEEETTSLEDVANAKPFVQYGNTLHFAEPTHVAIYSVSGVMLYNGIVTEYQLQAKGVYVVATANGSFRVLN